VSPLERERTICAVASPPGAAPRGIVRISGARAGELVARTCRPLPGAPGDLLPPPRRGCARARFHDGVGEQPVLLLWMPGPRSFTREDVAELHLSGHPALLARALERLLALGADPARPGEFTRRAFEHGRIDLTRAEGVLALIQARDRDERRAAAALLVGGLDRRLAHLRDALEDLRALTEASLDFDELDTGHVPVAELEAGRAALAAGLDEALAWETRRAPPRGEPRIVLVGAPNAGKSSLFNRLAAAAGAVPPSIVSELPGTTRDSREAAWLVAGVPCRLVDTAGVDPLARGVDAEAQARTAAERGSAELELWVVDATAAQPAPPPAEAGSPRVVAWNKSDLPAARPAPPGALATSAAEGSGLVELEARVAAALGWGSGPGSDPAPQGLARELEVRHRAALRLARDEVEAAGVGRAAGEPLDLFADHLREATAALDRITGRTTSEDLLDRIFARFCLGK